jgi:16S rRNA (cytidine1402-2'-O)-methyltransferase
MMTEGVPGTLVLIGTPIGNRGDLSARAREALLSADLLLCEDTRSPLRLLGLQGDALPPRTSCFVGNEHERVELLKRSLREGKTVAFVSEAGMPVWSDPGRILVEAAWTLGARIDAVPGPTAAATALALSAFEAEGAVFLGFLDRSGAGRKAQLEAVVESPGATLIYEAGNRTHQLLADLCVALGDEARLRLVFVARELTKAHQELMRSDAESLHERVDGPLRGEVCVVVEGRGDKLEDGDISPEQTVAREVFAVMTDPSLKPRARAKGLAQLTGLPAGELYKLLQRERS